MTCEETTLDTPGDTRVALITGAAGGIGAATADEFARRGYHLALVDVRESELAAVVKRVESHGVVVLPLAGDLSDLEFVESAVRSTIDKMGRIDALVNNAAWRETISMREITPASWEKTLRICLTAPAFLARWAAEDMLRRGSGVIVNVSSMMSRHAAGVAPAYVASKGALDSLTYELASLYGGGGVRVVAVNPGAIDTPLSRDFRASTDSESEDPIRQFSQSMIPLGRWGQPEEVARLIAWVASDEASYITGATLLVDGGWRHSHFPRELRP